MSTSTLAPGTYTADSAHSRLGFMVKHAMISKVRGSFNNFTAVAHLDPSSPENSSLEVTIESASIDTRNATRDQHLSSSDFLDAPNFPTIRYFAPTIVLPSELKVGDMLSVVGDLTIKGVTKPVTIDFEYTGSSIDPYNNLRFGFEATSVINRSDWGVSWNGVLEAGGVLVGEAVTLELEISAIYSQD